MPAHEKPNSAAAPRLDQGLMKAKFVQPSQNMLMGNVKATGKAGRRRYSGGSSSLGLDFCFQRWSWRLWKRAVMGEILVNMVIPSAMAAKEVPTKPWSNPWLSWKRKVKPWRKPKTTM